jgi:hypothetical protein
MPSSNRIFAGTRRGLPDLLQTSANRAPCRDIFAVHLTEDVGAVRVSRKLAEVVQLRGIRARSSVGEAGKNRAKGGRAVINSSGGEHGRPAQYPSA